MSSVDTRSLFHGPTRRRSSRGIRDSVGASAHRSFDIVLPTKESESCAKSSQCCGLGRSNPQHRGVGELRNGHVVGLVSRVQPGSGKRVLALTSDQRLVCFRRFTPAQARTVGSSRTSKRTPRILGIDHRPADGKLYGVGNQGGIYTVDPMTAKASLVVRMNVAGVPFVPSGASFGVDFNPAADRLRVVSDNGQNVRANVVRTVRRRWTAASTTRLGTPATGIGGAAYTNNDADPNTNTTLFDIDAALDQISIQSPPNNGSLVATGKLGVDSGVEIGADIDSDLKNGSTVANTAYVALNSGGTSRFFQVDVLTGKVMARWVVRGRNARHRHLGAAGSVGNLGGRCEARTVPRDRR